MTPVICGTELDVVVVALAGELDDADDKTELEDCARTRLAKTNIQCSK